MRSTLDPHATSDGGTQALNRQIYDTLVTRGPKGELVGELAASWRTLAFDAQSWEFRLRPGSQFPQRRRAHCRRRRVLAAAGAGAGLGCEGAPRLGRPRHQGRRPDVPRQDQGPEPAVPERPHRRVHPEPRLGRGGRRGAAAGLASRARRLHGAQRQRHRPLRARIARARRPHRAPAQRAILEQGPRRAARDHRGGPYADPLGRGADRGARRRRARLRPGRPGAGRRPPEEPAQRQPSPPATENGTVFLGLDVGLARAEGQRRQGQEPVRRQARPAGAEPRHQSASRCSRCCAARPCRPALLVPPAAAGWSRELDQPPAADAAKAKALLAEAGYPEGFTVTLHCPSDAIVNGEVICQEVVSMLARVGVVVDLVMLPKAQALAAIQKTPARERVLPCRLRRADARFRGRLRGALPHPGGPLRRHERRALLRTRSSTARSRP